MNEIMEYLKNCDTFYLATSEDGQAHVRPFGAVCVFENKLYIVTNNQKHVYRQMLKNPKVEICGMYKDTWIRVEGEVKEKSAERGQSCNDGCQCVVEQHVSCGR